MSTIPRIPDVKDFVRGIGKLVRVETVPPPPQPPPEIHYIFEEINARTELRLGDEVVKEVQTLNDFYGEGTSVESSIEEAKKMAAKRKLGPKSELEIVVIEIRSLSRHLRDDSKKDNFYDRDFVAFKDLERYASRNNLPEPKEKIVWTSRKP